MYSYIIHIYIYVFIYICKYIYVYIYMYTYIYMYIYIYTYTHIHIYIYTHIIVYSWMFAFPTWLPIITSKLKPGRWAQWTTRSTQVLQRSAVWLQGSTGFHWLPLDVCYVPSGYDCYSSPWKDPPFLRTVNPGKPSISMGHFPWLC